MTPTTKKQTEEEAAAAADVEAGEALAEVSGPPPAPVAGPQVWDTSKTRKQNQDALAG